VWLDMGMGYLDCDRQHAARIQYVVPGIMTNRNCETIAANGVYLLSA
jgi:hypothetical protein